MEPHPWSWIYDVTHPLRLKFPVLQRRLGGAQKRAGAKEPHDGHKSQMNLEWKTFDREAPWQSLLNVSGEEGPQRVHGSFGGPSSLDPFPRFLNMEEEEGRPPRRDFKGLDEFTGKSLLTCVGTLEA